MKEYHLDSSGAMTQKSSLGQLLKWKIDDTYIKTSTLDKTSLKTRFMYESYGEVIASRIAIRLGLNAVKYRLCKVIIDNSVETIACESKEFKPNGYTEFDIGKLIRNRKISVLGYGDTSAYNILKLSLSSVTGFSTYLDSIIFLDSLILNDDRHFGNFGIMINTTTGQARPLPIFDNGNGMFCHKHIDEMEYSQDLISYLICKPFNKDFDKQLKLITIKNKMKTRLFELKPYINNILSDMRQQGLNEHRAKFIKQLLYDRIDTIVNIA